MNKLALIARRSHPIWLAYLVHRVSGLALALFLPLHFWVLSMSVSHPEKINGLLYMNTFALKTAAEVVLVFLLAVHMFGGLRLMAFEWLPWSGWQKTLVALTLAFSFLVAVLFFLQVL